MTKGARGRAKYAGAPVTLILPSGARKLMPRSLFGA
jgi:hypothetical protein